MDKLAANRRNFVRLRLQNGKRPCRENNLQQAMFLFFFEDLSYGEIFQVQ